MRDSMWAMIKQSDTLPGMLGSVDDVYVYYIRCPHLVKYIEPDASAAITVEVYTIIATAAAAAPSCFPAAATAMLLSYFQFYNNSSYRGGPGITRN